VKNFKNFLRNDILDLLQRQKKEPDGRQGGKEEGQKKSLEGKGEWGSPRHYLGLKS